MEDVRKANGHDTWLRRLADRLFREQDAAAVRHGWQIDAGRNGLKRVYRDPRFDRFALCPQCRGSGTDQDQEPCGGCAGTGRTVLGPDSVSGAGRSRR
jgi:hypothetical protein